jgi:diguanylate cyclase (GGDEF)-like protein/PAS domain S-box-containing protein
MLRKFSGKTAMGYSAALAYRPIVSEEGKASGIYSQGRDMFKKKYIKEELLVNEELCRALIGHIAQAVWETDAKGRVAADSPSWRAYTGQTVEEWMANGWLKATHPDDMQHATQKWQEAIMSHDPFNGEYRLQERSGEWRWTNVRAVPIFNPDGTVRKWVGMSIDISGRKLAEERLFHSEEFHRVTAEAAHVGVWEFNAQHKNICTMSPLMAQMLDLPANKTVFTFEEWQENIFPEDRAVVRAGLESLLENRKSSEVLLRVRWKNGSVRHLIARGKAIKDREGNVTRVFGAAIDMTEQKKAQEELMIAYERLGLAISSTGDGLWDWDFENNTAYFSGRFKEILGFDDHELPDHTATWPVRIHPEDESQVMAAYYDYMHGRIPSFMAEYRIECKTGEWKWVLSRGVLVRQENDGKPRRMIGMLSDISQRKAADEQIWRHANFDALTSLPNRRLFRDRLEQKIRKAQRSKEAVALLFIDLDRFKQINDLLGHDAGDLLLIEAARRIESCVRTTDTVARLGGDEFTVILSELDDTRKVETIAQNILDKLAESFQITKEIVYVSGSIGIALYPDDALTAEEMIRKADQAMYAAKHAGKNQFSYFTQLMDERAHQRIRLINELRNALNRQQLSIAYQPVVELATNRIVKAEALLRWLHPVLGNIEPSRFVPLAEEAGLIIEIGDWVFRKAAACAKRWSDCLGAPFQVGVNKSPIQFLSKEEDNWISYLQGLGLSAQNIAVEITEGLLMQASSNVCNKLIEYRDAGIQVALDDFGVGYSSMSYLKKFDIDYLKIDQSFVQDMTDNEQSRTIAESIIVMAHKLGLKVIAEGIETDEQRALLLEAGCDFGQGFLFSQPVTEIEFERKFVVQNAQYIRFH